MVASQAFGGRRFQGADPYCPPQYGPRASVFGTFASSCKSSSRRSTCSSHSFCARVSPPTIPSSRPRIFLLNSILLPGRNSITRAPLSERLKAHDRERSSTAFGAESFSCGICLEDKKGTKCVRLEGCSHVCVCGPPPCPSLSSLSPLHTGTANHALLRILRFCDPCLVSYFTLLITEGLVRSVHCPAIPCVQSRAAHLKANPPTLGATEPVHDSSRPGEVGREEVEKLVGKESAERWEKLCEKVRMESGEPFLSSLFCFSR